MVPWLTEIKELILTLNQVLKGKKIKGLVLKTLPSTVSSLSMLPQNLPVLFEISQMPKMGGYFDVQNQRRLVDFKIIQAPGARG
jgi:hypothetical protein